MSDSVRPHRRQPTRLPRPWDSPGKNTGVGYHFLLQCMKVKSESKLLSHVRLLATPWTAAYQAPPSMGFSRHEYWSGVPLPSPPVNPKGNQSWIFTGRTDAEAEAPILWPPDAKNWFLRKDPDVGNGRRKEKGMIEDEMDGWHHQLNGHEFEQNLGNGEEQGILACCSLWGHKELETTKWLNNNHIFFSLNEWNWRKSFKHLPQ